MPPAIQNPSLTAFKPRSVILSNQAMNNLSNKTSKTLNPCQKKTLLHSSILHYLQRSGFSKTLKYFQREAPLEVKMSANIHFVMLAFFFLRLDGEKIRLKGRNGFWLLGAVEIFTFPVVFKLPIELVNCENVISIGTSNIAFFVFFSVWMLRKIEVKMQGSCVFFLFF